MGGHPIQCGQRVMFLLGSANRDPDQFPDPDRLNIRRDSNQHLAFAMGSHFCIGAPLARLEAGIALAALLGRFPKLRLAQESPVWMPSYQLRKLESLPIVF